jgi:pimeloyl-ACP methyl ester carboxylesterase
MGASNAAMVAGEYSDLVSRIILEDPVWRLDAVESAKERQARLDEWRQEVIENRSKTREELIAFVRQRSPTWSEIDFGDWADAKELVNPNVLEFVSTERSWERGIPKIVCPTLLVTANPDLGALVTPQVSKQISEKNANFQVIHIEGAGHNIRREQFQAYVEGVKRFLVKTSPEV